MSRKPRNANRGTTQAIEDGFCDLPIAAQERMLETLAGLHRQAVRMSRDNQPGLKPSEAFERGKQILNGAPLKDAADPGKNAALDLPLEHEQ